MSATRPEPGETWRDKLGACYNGVPASECYLWVIQEVTESGFVHADAGPGNPWKSLSAYADTWAEHQELVSAPAGEEKGDG